MKRILSIVLLLVLLLSAVPLAKAAGGSTLLKSLTHNCPNTGIMVPKSFNPNVTSYLLTVASWVSRPTFTPTAYDSNARITVNGVEVKSGATSQVIPMTDEPQAVTIVVTNGNASTTYTIFLQRRPSEKRTRVSAGYINSIQLKGTTWRLDADLFTVRYLGGDYESGNRSTFTNTSRDSYVYDIDPNCIFYYGSPSYPVRAVNVQEFAANYQAFGSTMYTIIYIEDEIVCVLPYGADY